MRIRALAALISAAAAYPLLLWVRGYPWLLAVLTAFAIGAMAYALVATIEHLRRVQRAHRVEAADRDSDGDRERAGSP